MLRRHYTRPGSGTDVAVLSRGEVYHAKVNPHEIRRGDRCGVGDIYCDEQEPFTVMAEHQVSLPLGVGELFGLVLAHDDRNEQAPRQRKQAHPVDTLELAGSFRRLKPRNC